MMDRLKVVPGPAEVSITPVDVERALAVILLAFTADPVVRWKYPDPAQFLALFPKFVRAFGGAAFERQTARFVEGYRGVALWLPPGIELDHAAIEASLPAGREAEIVAVFEKLAPHHPNEAHWYLPLIGVDPSHQRKGYGAALLEDVLRLCDQDHLAAYLESTNSANIPLYQRHGFELQGTIQVGSSPPLFPMLRRAR
jgi:GNAT superfamily N-acetyltransferase